MAEVHAIWALMLLLSSVQLARTINDRNSKDTGFRRTPECNFYEGIDTINQCSPLMVGVVSIYTSIVEGMALILIK